MSDSITRKTQTWPKKFLLSYCGKFLRNFSNWLEVVFVTTKEVGKVEINLQCHLWASLKSSGESRRFPSFCAKVLDVFENFCLFQLLKTPWRCCWLLFLEVYEKPKWDKPILFLSTYKFSSGSDRWTFSAIKVNVWDNKKRLA